MASENEVRSRSDSAPVPTSGFSDALSGVWQSAWWNDFLVRTGWARSGAFVESSDGSGRVSARFELRSVGLGLTGMFSVGGPETSGNPGTSAWKDFSKNARREAEIAGAAFVQIEPLSENPGIPGFSGGEYRHFLEKRTLLIDLSQSEESILGQMKEKGRYNVRLAEKRGVSVRMAEPTEENVAEFLRLLRETLERDGFSGNSSGYYLELVRTLDAENAGGLFFAEKGGEVVAAAITTFWKGTATYYYGASTSDNEKRRDMPAYLLQWEMMREWKRRGCRWYDFLGIAPEGVANHPLSGVTDFKLKFGGSVRQWPESRTMVVRPAAYALLRAARFFRRLAKR